VAVVLYLVSPIDLIPDMLPIVGVLDDLVIVPMALRWLLSRLPSHIRDYAEAKAQGQDSATHPRPSQSTQSPWKPLRR
jgi:uncharacterized membrane protein YkvA (DUF1232 family)